jgi:hypothetical protein
LSDLLDGLVNVDWPTKAGLNQPWAGAALAQTIADGPTFLLHRTLRSGKYTSAMFLLALNSSI